MIGEGSVAGLVAGIASTEPAPGAGAAGAVALALAVGCARKAVRMTLRHGADPALAAADAALAAYGDAALAGADHDAARFTALIAALRLPHAAREEAVQASADALVSLGDRLLALGDAVAAMLDTVAPQVRNQMANDILAARALVAAAQAIQHANRDESRDMADAHHAVRAE